MAYDTVESVLAGLRSDDATLRLIRDRALKTSAIGKIRPGQNFTQPSIRGTVPGARLTAAAHASGANKTLASGILTTVNFSVHPVALVVPIENDLWTSGQDLQQAVITSLTEGIAVGLDNEIINNPNSVFADSIVASATAASNVKTSTLYLYNDMSDTFDMVQGTYYNVDGVIGRRGDIGGLRLAVPSGQTMFTPLFDPTPDGAVIFHAPAEFVDGRVLPKTGSGSEVRFIVGDWTQLYWGTYGPMRIKLFDQATIGAYNAAAQNLTLVIAEVSLGFQVVNDAAFAILTE